jgi:very-short-patch-repair endonuclease
MRVQEALQRLGGVASRATLIEATSRRAVDRALRQGRIVRDAHGRYASPTADEAVRAASRLSGVLGLRSAVNYWGWEQKSPPTEPEILVRRGRKLTSNQRRGVKLHWINVEPAHVHAGIVTDRGTTLQHCLRDLPYDEALAIADSARRHRDIGHDDLIALADKMRGPGSAQARKVARHADPRAANPFESVLRAIATGVRGLQVIPQRPIGTGPDSVTPDLVDERLGIVLEADSFSWHGIRRFLRRDCRRYNWLTLRGWLVLRFAWEDVMFDPGYVRDCLEQAVQLVVRRTHRSRSRRLAA